MKMLVFAGIEVLIEIIAGGTRQVYEGYHLCHGVPESILNGIMMALPVMLVISLVLGVSGIAVSAYGIKTRSGGNVPGLILSVLAVVLGGFLLIK